MKKRWMANAGRIWRESGRVFQGSGNGMPKLCRIAPYAVAGLVVLRQALRAVPECSQGMVFVTFYT